MYMPNETSNSNNNPEHEATTFTTTAQNVPFFMLSTIASPQTTRQFELIEKRG